MLAATKPLQDKLLTEMLDRIPREEQSTPQRYKSHYYYSIHKKGMQYRLHCRRKFSAKSLVEEKNHFSEHDMMDVAQPEEVLLDEDSLAQGLDYFDLTGFVVSPDEKLVAYAVDSDGSEVYTLFVKNLATGELVLDGRTSKEEESFRGATGDIVFLNDSTTILYTTQTTDTRRPNKVWRYTLLEGNNKQRQPELLYEEPDESFHLAVWLSRTENYVYLRGRSEVTHYMYYMPAADNNNSTSTSTSAFTRLVPAVDEHQYVVRDDGANGLLYAIVYTPEERNGKLIVTDLVPDALYNNNRSSTSASDENNNSDDEDISSRKQWTVLQQHSRDIELVDITVSSTHIAVLERKNGTLVATTYKLPTTRNDSGDDNMKELPTGKQLVFDDPSYILAFGDQGVYESSILRVEYSSLTQPESTYDVNMETGNRVLKRQQHVVGYDSSLYHSQLLWAPTTIGVEEGEIKVPISMVYRRDAVRLDGSDPLLLDAYGAYGATNDPSFSGWFVFLIALNTLHFVLKTCDVDLFIYRNPVEFIGSWVYIRNCPRTWWR